ncbi:tRNA lysidine(34) synthetase TilS [Ramlibacter tataouinensis]|uniref:tRNA(Ile)-lysidine synthase n=1 Tax=Ramlibacter tataouinensis (strain ATCC BAA-407 / DSM 14655 / LMG 21543 / TTB310) TaxID=365046 RepID=F5Y4X8_RAMTT|nr:tRNA lysidine(34) synthetase TilS [Ramlibacter tataouinensis]AEG92634.1 Candidate tRNA(Ile)-lysidine synthetase [Ramlibacter tataouinensis TTB310]
MAASPTPRPTPAEPPGRPDPVLAPLQALNPPHPLGVAFSGGADSTALLFAAARQWPGAVHAVHVHHGLQAAADAFTEHCARSCEGLGVPLHVRRVDARPAAGESPEDAARGARYQALAAAARDAGLACVLLAQHADDQAETLLLALSRGAGLPGLASMPARFERHGVVFLRPLLAVPGARLRNWAREQAIAFIEDPTNADTRYTRNRIRRDLLPALERAFPAFRETFARSARHAAQAQRLLDEVAAADLAAMGGEPDIGALQVLSCARQGNLLRYWLRTVHAQQPSAAQLDELLAQVADCTTRGHRLRLKVGAGFVLRDGPRLRFAGG